MDTNINGKTRDVNSLIALRDTYINMECEVSIYSTGNNQMFYFVSMFKNIIYNW